MARHRPASTARIASQGVEADTAAATRNKQISLAWCFAQVTETNFERFEDQLSEKKIEHHFSRK